MYDGIREGGEGLATLLRRGTWGGVRYFHKLRVIPTSIKSNLVIALGTNNDSENQISL